MQIYNIYFVLQKDFIENITHNGESNILFRI